MIESNEIKKVLFFGQTPPPHHGQAIIIDKLARNEKIKEEIIFINLSNTSTLDKIAKFQLKKVTYLFKLIFLSAYYFYKYDISAVYYPPAGTKFVPFARDLILLTFLRWFGKPLIFHFHPMGFREEYEKGSSLKRLLMRKAYHKPELCICLSNNNISDIEIFEPQQTTIIPNGIEDHFYQYETITKYRSGNSDNVRVLYVGNIYKSKGVTLLLNAVKGLNEQGIPFELNFVGGVKDEAYKKEIEAHPAYSYPHVNFLGIKTGKDKWKLFAQSDIFCFPTFYERENLPIVLIEAMQFALPIVTSRWRGIPELVEEGQNAFLIEPENSQQLSEHLKTLICDPEIRKQMGKKSRNRYLKKYTVEEYTNSFLEIFSSFNDHADRINTNS